MYGDISTEIIAALFSIVIKLSADPLAGTVRTTLLPEVHRIPHAQVEAMTCGTPCRVRAIYLTGLGIFVDDDLDIENDELARSILLHELVHHLQAVLGKYEDLSVCEASKRREIDAYAIQNEYLEAANAGTRVMPALNRGLRCE
jgi:hypothetical protein